MNTNHARVIVEIITHSDGIATPRVISGLLPYEMTERWACWRMRTGVSHNLQQLVTDSNALSSHIAGGSWWLAWAQNALEDRRATPRWTRLMIKYADALWHTVFTDVQRNDQLRDSRSTWRSWETCSRRAVSSWFLTCSVLNANVLLLKCSQLASILTISMGQASWLLVFAHYQYHRNRINSDWTEQSISW